MGHKFSASYLLADAGTHLPTIEGWKTDLA